MVKQSGFLFQFQLHLDSNENRLKEVINLGLPIKIMPKNVPKKRGLIFESPFLLGGRSVSNRRPPEPQSGALTN